MKTINRLSFLLVGALVANTAGAVDLKTDDQKFSYVAGFQIAQSLKRDGMAMDVDAFVQAIRDVLTDATLKMSHDEMLAVVQARRDKVMKSRSELITRKQAEEKTYLEANSKKDGVKALPNGIQYKVLKEGNGDQVKAGDTVSVNYRGTLLDGTEFDSSYKRGKPATFATDQVIEGWQAVLPLMHEGDKWEVVIPAKLAYGDNGKGGVIGPAEPLVFEIELIDVK